VGNSLAVRIPLAIARQAGLAEGDSVKPQAGVIGDDGRITQTSRTQLPSGPIEVTFTGQY
jgi:antitoxin component of MazEF toxin-antitoxin module